MDGKKRIEVVAAIILHNGRILVCSRPAHSAHAGFWEFPGGKVEEGETHREALVREIREELACDVVPDTCFWRLEHDYPGKSVRVTFFFAHPAAEDFKLAAEDGQDIRCVLPEELKDVNFLPADFPVAEALYFFLKKQKKTQ